MDLNRFLAVGQRWLWLLVLASSLSALLALLVDTRREALYESQVQLLVGPALKSSNVDLNDLRVGSQLVQVYADLVMTRPVLQTVIDDLELVMTPDALKASIKVVPLPDTQVLKIRVRVSDPYWAALIANTLAAALVNRSPGVASEQQIELRDTIQSQIARLSEHIALIEADMASVQAQFRQSSAGRSDPTQLARLDDLRTQLGASYTALANLYAKLPGNDANQIEIIEPAVPRLGSVEPQIPLDVLLGTAAGLVTAAALVLFLEYVNDTISVVEDLSSLNGLAVVGTIAHAGAFPGGLGQLATLSLADSRAAEDYRVLRTNLATLGVARSCKCLVVTSPDGGDGKSEVAANLAVAFAQVGERVILVDADLWEPRVAQLFDIPQIPGVTDALVNSPAEPELVRVPQALWAPTLRVLPGGLIPSNPSAMLTSQRWHRLLHDLKQQADLVILDSAPVLSRAGTLLLARQADALLLTVNMGKTSRRSLRRAVDSLRLAGAGAIRVVVNESDHERRPPARPLPARRTLTLPPGANGRALAQREARMPAGVR